MEALLCRVQACMFLCRGVTASTFERAEGEGDLRLQRWNNMMQRAVR